MVVTTRGGITTAVQNLLDNREASNAMARAVNPCADGPASKKIADHLETAIKAEAP